MVEIRSLAHETNREKQVTDHSPSKSETWQEREAVNSHTQGVYDLMHTQVQERTVAPSEGAQSDWQKMLNDFDVVQTSPDAKPADSRSEKSPAAPASSKDGKADKHDALSEKKPEPSMGVPNWMLNVMN